VVASGSLGGAVGVVQPVAQLPSEAPAEAQVLLVETMTGWEENGGCWEKWDFTNLKMVVSWLLTANLMGKMVL
jgi:hypothetical protein